VRRDRRRRGAGDDDGGWGLALKLVQLAQFRLDLVQREDLEVVRVMVRCSTLSVGRPSIRLRNASAARKAVPASSARQPRRYAVTISSAWAAGAAARVFLQASSYGPLSVLPISARSA
jgi:hypothetical protein